jgi:site-specific DNA-methyltransferase (adenine-specific)
MKPGFGDTGSAARFFYCAKASRSEREMGLEGMEVVASHSAYGDFAGTPEHATNTNGAARNHHPTVKPLSLMRYLVRLTKTPTGGTVLDPFMGSGTTGMACVLEGRDFVGIELDESYCAIARRRIAAAAAQGVLI